MEQLRAWVERVTRHLDAHCPEYAPAFSRLVTGLSMPGNLIVVYLDRLFDIQRALLATPGASSSRPS